MLEVAVEKALAMLTEADGGHDERREKVEHELVKTQSRIDRLVGALADASLPSDEITPQLTAEKARKTALEDELRQLDRPSGATPDMEGIRRRVQTLGQDVAAHLFAEASEARRVLRAIVHGKIELEPVGKGRRRGYRFRGWLKIGGLIAGTASIRKNTSERGGPNGTRTRV